MDHPQRNRLRNSGAFGALSHVPKEEESQASRSYFCSSSIAASTSSLCSSRPLRSRPWRTVPLGSIRRCDGGEFGDTQVHDGIVFLRNFLFRGRQQLEGSALPWRRTPGGLSSWTLTPRMTVFLASNWPSPVEIMVRWCSRGHVLGIDVSTTPLPESCRLKPCLPDYQREVRRRRTTAGAFVSGARGEAIESNNSHHGNHGDSNDKHVCVPHHSPPPEKNSRLALADHEIEMRWRAGWLQRRCGNAGCG